MKTVLNSIHLTFILFSVFDLRKHHVLFELIFWLLASLSCYNIGTSLYTTNLDVDSTTSSISNNNNDVKSTTISKKSTTTKLNSKAKAKAKAPSIKILQARWGTTTKDIDVTSLVQKMVTIDPATNKSTLFISKTLQFNKIFTDPAKFRRKHLRIVALIDEEPYINTIHELRKQDFELKSGRGVLDKEADALKAIQAQEDIETKDNTNTATATATATTTTTTTTASSSTTSQNSSCHPVVNNIKETYKHMSATPFQNQTIEAVCDSATLVAEFIGLFGTSFLPVRANVTDNVNKIRTKCDLISSKNPSLSLSTVGEYIGYERVRNGEHKEEGSVTLSMLWLKRGLDFLDRFLKKFIDGTKTKAAARDAFETTLAPYQGWLLRTTCKAGLKMVPTREKLGMILMLPTIDPMYWNEIVEEELRLLMSSYSIVILGMDEWFENEGLDDKTKA